jgi:hypothetical protein
MPVRFQRGSERMFRSVFPILAIFTILVSSSACVAAGARIEGIWRITAISFPGKMEFYRTGGIWAGRINFGPGQPWDELTNIYFDPQSGEIQFTRPRNNQWYTGILTGNRFTGTLTEGERTYNWEARRP